MKQSLDKIHDSKFDREYEAMCKEKGVTSQQVLTPLPKEKLIPQSLFDYVQVKIALPKPKPVKLNNGGNHGGWPASHNGPNHPPAEHKKHPKSRPIIAPEEHPKVVDKIDTGNGGPRGKSIPQIIDAEAS